jgi:hypothetical protein
VIKRDALRGLLTDNQFNRYFWALVVAALYNTVARYFKVPDRQVAVVGDAAFLEQFCDSLGLLFYQKGRVTRNNVKEIENHDLATGVVFDTAFDTALQWLDNATDKNIITAVSQTQASVMSGDHWLFLPIRKTKWERERLEGLGSLFVSLIKAIQLEKTPDKIDVISFICGTISKWLEFKLKDSEGLAVVQEAGLLFKHGSLVGKPLDAVARFMHVMFAKMRNGEALVQQTVTQKPSRTVRLHIQLSRELVTVQLASAGPLAIQSDLQTFIEEAAKHPSVAE